MFKSWSSSGGEFSFFIHFFKLICLYLAAHNAVVLKAESTADKAEWINKISKVIQARGGLVRVAESGHTMRQSLSDGSLVSLHSLNFAIQILK